MKKHNFSAGPSILPAEVLEKASLAVQDLQQTGLSVLEISHRSKDFIQIMNDARNLALELAGLQNKGYQALFLHGGARTQFLMVAYNLLQQKAAYADTGTWAHVAFKEAQNIGKVEVVASSAQGGYRFIPQEITADASYDYLHITTNNTIYGTQYQQVPQVDIPLVADMSSDIFSRVFPYEKFSLIYAGAQKNLGPAGTTLVLVKEDILGKVQRQIPSMLSYQEHIQKESMANTPTTFAIYVSLLTMQWLKAQGGLPAIEKINREKARILYQEIDRNALFDAYAHPDSRSMMNVVFTLKNPALEQKFNDFWEKANISGLKGHRSVGGYRASIYNAMPLQSVQLLVQVMQEFEKKYS